MYPYVVAFGMGFYEILLTVGMLIVLFSADKMGIKRGFSVKLQKLLIIDGVASIFIGLFGAVVFQAFYDFMATGVFKISATTGMTFYGGLIFGVISFLLIWFFGGKAVGIGEEVKEKFEDIADIAGCLIPLAHGFGRLGCFFAGCCHGAETDAWYGVKMYTETGWKTVVPLQLYEAIFLFALAGLMIYFYIKRTGEKRIPLITLYAASYGVWRFCLEFARGDDRGATIIPFLSPSQLVAIIMITAAIVYFWGWYKLKQKTPVVVLETQTTEVVENTEAVENIEEAQEEQSETVDAQEIDATETDTQETDTQDV